MSPMIRPRLFRPTPSVPTRSERALELTETAGPPSVTASNTEEPRGQIATSSRPRSDSLACPSLSRGGVGAGALSLVGCFEGGEEGGAADLGKPPAGGRLEDTHIAAEFGVAQIAIGEQERGHDAEPVAFVDGGAGLLPIRAILGHEARGDEWRHRPPKRRDGGRHHRSRAVRYLSGPLQPVNERETGRRRRGRGKLVDEGGQLILPVGRRGGALEGDDALRERAAQPGQQQSGPLLVEVSSQRLVHVAPERCRAERTGNDIGGPAGRPETQAPPTLELTLDHHRHEVDLEVET